MQQQIAQLMAAAERQERVQEQILAQMQAQATATPAAGSAGPPAAVPAETGEAGGGGARLEREVARQSGLLGQLAAAVAALPEALARRLQRRPEDPEVPHTQQVERTVEVPQGPAGDSDYTRVISGEDWASFTVPMLKEWLRSRGLPSSGKKAELLARARAHSEDDTIHEVIEDPWQKSRPGPAPPDDRDVAECEHAEVHLRGNQHGSWKVCKKCSQRLEYHDKASGSTEHFLDVASLAQEERSTGGQSKGSGNKGKSSKGKGKGCFICGGDHYARKCPKRQQSARSLHEEGTGRAPPHAQEPQQEQGAGETGHLGGLFITALMDQNESNELMAVNDMLRGGRKVRFGVDSGAAATVIQSAVCSDYPINRKQKKIFRTASKETLETEGRRTLGLSDGCFVRADVAQDLSKNLMAVAHLCDSGHRVVFDNEEGYFAMHKKTGRKMGFQRSGNVFDVELEVVPFAQAPGACSVETASGQAAAAAAGRSWPPFR